jgi:hypothetical protein
MRDLGNFPPARDRIREEITDGIPADGVRRALGLFRLHHRLCAAFRGPGTRIEERRVAGFDL